MVHIVVTDDGHGIDPERLRRKAVERGWLAEDQAAKWSDRELIGLIFRPGFSTADAPTMVSGRGVGMDVVKSRVESIGGSVDASSRPGVGTTIKLTIPLTLTIINALLVRNLLTRLGHRPVMAADGGEAAAAFVAARAAGTPFDLVLMDLHMPGINGIEAAGLIRAAESGGARSTPIVALTADAFPENRDACIAAGINGFLTKPLDRERLMAALAECGVEASRAA